MVWIALILFILFSACVISACAMNWGIKRSIARADRDPLTGVVRGLEAVTLKPTGPITPATQDTVCLLVHGFIGSPRDFNQLGRHLTDKGFSVRVLRLPGHCTTCVDFAHLPKGELLKAVRQEYLDLRSHYKRVYVIGFSMGGSLATLLASQEPVDRLVLLAPYYAVTYHWYYILPPEAWNALLSPMISYVPKLVNFVKVNDRSVVSQIFTYDYLPTAGARQLMDLGRQARRPEVLEKIKCPVIVIHSTGDEAASPSASRKAFQLMASPQKEYVTFKRSNHILLWDYDRDEATQRIEDFLVSPGSDKLR